MSECYSFVVNGVPCSTEEEKPLLRYLRDELRLTSVKDGCSEGACGTCTILVDGKAVKACVLSTKRAAGKEIVTVEGLSEAEREAFVYAFGAVGAVQCGFCIPGMVMAGKALLDQNPNPSEAEIKKAIRGNVCRCTGYKKIIEGIALAGAILRGEASVDPALEEGEDYGVGARAFRTDVRDKVLGRGEYCDDLYLDGMAHASAVRSQYPRARVLDIDPSAALALPGVLAVLTADDVPHNKVGHLQQDWDVMIAKGDITRCVGDAVCLVVAENEAVLKQAKELVKVDYEPLEPVRTIQEARAADAPSLHPNGNLCQQRHVTRGDARAALAQSKYVVTQSYRTPFTEHAFLEPECAVAFPYKDGVKVYTSDQGVYDTRKEISIMLGWEPERIVVENGCACGVEAGGAVHYADYVVCDADFPYAITQLVDEADARGKYTPQKIEEMEYSCSCFILYLGLDKRYPSDAVHSIRFASASACRACSRSATAPSHWHSLWVTQAIRPARPMKPCCSYGSPQCGQRIST